MPRIDQTQLRATSNTRDIIGNFEAAAQLCTVPAQALGSKPIGEIVRFPEYAVPQSAQPGTAIQRVIAEHTKVPHSRAFRGTGRLQRVRHLFHKLHPTRTNGKAEHIIMAARRELIDGRKARNSQQRTTRFNGRPPRHEHDWHQQRRSLGGTLPMNRFQMAGHKHVRPDA